MPARIETREPVAGLAPTPHWPDLTVAEPPPLSPFAIDGVDAAGLFLPGFDRGSLSLLAERIERRNEARLVAAQTVVEAQFDHVDGAGAFCRAVERTLKRSAEERRALLGAPATRAALRLLMRVIGRPRPDPDVAPRGLRARMRDVTRLLNDGDCSGGLQRDGLPFAVYQHDLDPVLKLAIPPSYRFNEVSRRADERSAYSTAIFAEAALAAIDRIASIWPDFVIALPRLVQGIIHLPSARFRSCSADRYAGLIILTASDETVFGVEELIIHEFAHQILYCVVELDSLFVTHRQKRYALPWSGSLRDAYGYFHALFVYFTLAVYFDAALARPYHDRDEVETRLSQVLNGISKALIDFRGYPDFTPTGRVFFENLDRWASDLVARHPRLAAQ